MRRRRRMRRRSIRRRRIRRRRLRRRRRKGRSRSRMRRMMTRMLLTMMTIGSPIRANVGYPETIMSSKIYPTIQKQKISTLLKIVEEKAK